MNARTLPFGPPGHDGLDETIDIAIIGTGFAGLGMAIRLRQTGVTDFVVLEKAASVGGTWRDNHYPVCVRRAIARLFVLVRAEPALDAHVRAAAGNPRLSGRLRAALRRRPAPAPEP